MNKKLLFGALALAALTACTTDDFESQKVAEEMSPVQFEVINNDALTRASMDGNSIVWSAKDGDLFTLYHGDFGGLNAFENATYKASAAEGKPAVLTTPSVIKPGLAVMTWPVDTTFRISNGDALTIAIPADQKEDVENYLPYMSDFIAIGGYAAYSETLPVVMPTAYNTAGYDRKYPVYMRPMASQLNIKTDYAGTDATIATLYTGDDPIEPIKLTSVDLLTTVGGGTTDFTTEIPVKFTAPTAAIVAQWNAAQQYNSWVIVSDFDVPNIAAAGQTDKLSTVCLTGNDGCKFLILPQAPIAGGVDDGAVVFNTIYGKVVVAAPGVAGSLYTAGEAGDAWYRYIKPATAAEAYENKVPVAEASGDNAGKHKTTAAPADGMMQTINGFSSYIATSGVVKGEPVGAAATRYVKVLLTHLDMTDLHIKSDKQLRDAAKVWKKMGLTPVTVYLDGDANTEFEISQKTIQTINEINGGGLGFQVKPCQNAGEACNTIVITGGGNVQDIAFIEPNGAFVADVALKKGENWSWKFATTEAKTVKVKATGVNSIINRGTFVSDANAILQTAEPGGAQNNIPFVNASNAKWNITGGTIRVQFDVTNNGELTISKGAQYRQDGNAGNTTFTNQATAKPSRFGGNDARIGKVYNSGVFATLGTGTAAKINNYGLIEHADAGAKTYITTNQLGGNFANAFSGTNKIGRINLPWSNRMEDNVSISAALTQGFVSVTVDGEVTGALNAAQLGDKVNYLIIKSGPTEINNVAAQVDYLEVNADKEIAWTVMGAPQNFVGLMVLSDLNIKLNTTVNVTKATYLGSDMYVGGNFTWGSWNGYYGNTTANAATKYITY